VEDSPIIKIQSLGSFRLEDILQFLLVAVGALKVINQLSLSLYSCSAAYHLLLFLSSRGPKASSLPSKSSSLISK
jgi:hypothetical protein